MIFNLDGVTLTQAMLNSIALALFGSAMAFAMAWFWYAKGVAVDRAKAIAVEHEKLQARVVELESRERVAGQLMTPIVTAFQAILVKQLTHLDKPEMDELMAKLGPPNVLTVAEHDRLIGMLHHRSEDMGLVITDAERAAAKTLLLVMPMAKVEQAHFAEAGASDSLKLVTIISVTGGTEKREPRRQSE